MSISSSRMDTLYATQAQESGLLLALMQKVTTLIMKFKSTEL